MRLKPLIRLAEFAAARAFPGPRGRNRCRAIGHPTGIRVGAPCLDSPQRFPSEAWSIAPQLLLPIFDAGRNQADFEVAQVNREILLAQYEPALQAAFREVADALAGRATLTEQLPAQTAQANAEAVRARLADLRYRNGAASLLEVLDAQRALFAAQQAVVQVQAARALNGVALYKALGGGWTAERP